MRSRRRRTRKSKRLFPRFWLSRRGFAVPVTFLMLFVSLTTIISVTYYFAVSKVDAKSQSLKVSLARQTMTSLENVVQLVAWHPGASKTYEFYDCGGELNVEPTAKNLLINVTDDVFSDVVFNASVGRVAYKLPYSEQVDLGLFLKGDSRTVVNSSGSTMAQLYIAAGSERPEIVLCYRPMASSVSTGLSGGKPVNVARVYVINLNSSQSIELMGTVPLRVACLNVESVTHSHDLSYQPQRLLVKATLDGEEDQVSLPVSSNANGAIIRVELVVCNIRVERLER